MASPAVNVLRLYKSKCIGKAPSKAVKRIEAADAVFGEVAAHLEALCRVPLKPSTCAVAKNLFAEAYMSGALAPRRVECALASVLFIACRMEGDPWFFSEICGAMGCADSRKGWRTYKLVHKACGSPSLPHVQGDALIRRCCVGAGIDDPGVVTAALVIYKRACALEIGWSRHPGGGACACVYMAARLRPGGARAMLDISPYSGASKDIAKKWYREMWPHRAEIVPLSLEGGAWSTTSAEVAALEPRVR